MSAAVTWISGAVVRRAGVCRGSLAAERWRWAIKELFAIMNKYGHSRSKRYQKPTALKMETQANLEKSMEVQLIQMGQLLQHDEVHGRGRRGVG